MCQRLLTAVHTLLERPGARAAAHNLGWLAAEKAVRLVFSVGVGFWVARHLGRDQFGRLNYALAVVGMCTVLAECGLEAVVRRELIHRPERSGALLAAVWRLRLAVGATCYAVVAIWSIVGVADRAERGVLIAAGGLLFQPGLAVADLWLQANLRARTATIAQMLALTAGAGARVALILADAPLWTFGAAAAAEAGVAAAILTVLARRIGLRIAAERDSWALLRPLLRDAWPLLLSSASIAIYMRIDVVMLRNLAGDGAVGIYTAAVRLSEMSYFLPIAMGASLLPSLLRARAAGEAAYAERMQQYFDLSAGLAYAVALPLAVASPWVVQLAYGAQFAAAAPVLALHVWATLFVFLGVARGQFLVNESLTFFYLLATAAGAVVNIALNALLIPRIGAIGTALATVTSYATAAWLSSYLHPAVRSTAVRQTRALLLPLTGWRYLRRS